MIIHQKIAAITGELSQIGVQKNRENKQQGFWFRSIDDIYQVLAPLLFKHGVVVVPSYSNRTVVEKPTKSGSLQYVVCLEGKFDFFAAEDGSCVTAHMYGEGMDTGDKATNKAMSAAYKYACIQTFCIPVEGNDDADASHPQETEVEDTTIYVDAVPTAPSDFEWREIVCHVGKEPKGKKLGDITEKLLQTMIRMYKPLVTKKGISEADATLRMALNAAKAELYPED